MRYADIYSRAVSACSLYTVDESVARIFRARQIGAILRHAHMTALANSLNALIVVAAFWSTANRPLLLVWTVFVFSALVNSLRARRHAPAMLARGVSARTMRRAVLNGGMIAALWGVMPLALMPGADSAQLLLLTTIATGMICAGGFALATAPWAATAYVLVLGSCLELAISLTHQYALVWASELLTAVYVFIVVVSVWSTARTFSAQLIAESRAAAQREVIGLLLRDFEENSSDVLWEVDRDGYLQHASPRLIAVLDIDAAKGARIALLEALKAVTPNTDEAGAHLRSVVRLIRRQKPIRDATFFTQGGGQTRCWSVTAKPLLDIAGKPVGWRGVASEITDAHASRKRLTWLAHFDSLTGLLNRPRLKKEVDDLILVQPDKHFAVLCLDLDHFKNVNDTLGHAIGDGLLQEVAKRLTAVCTPRDLVARLGGDEFVIVARDTGSAREAEELARRVLAALTPACEVQGACIAVRASLGVALAPLHGCDLEALLANADLAMYAAKTGGRGTFQTFTPEMANKARRRLFIEGELRNALSNDELHLVYQPQVDIRSKTTLGFEALLRWSHPALGEVSPAEFVPIAEDAGLIRSIGQWVLTEACRTAATWPDELTVAVNISAVQAMSGDLCKVVADALQQARLMPHRLELEITESVFLNETDLTIERLGSLRRSGVRIALDDFGTGFSSLSYLRRFPFDTVKIDRSFISEITSSRQLRAIVKMIIVLARTLEMTTVAEGVESEDQANVLARYLCDSVQGYLYSKPLPPQRIPAFLRSLKTGRPLAHDIVVTTDLLPLA